MDKPICSISVISSSVCNLNCSFCYLHKNSSYKEYDKLVRAAWQDGSYLDNVLNTVKGLNGDPTQVTTMQLWGGETLLHIEDIILNMPKFYRYFPNINDWKVSTNLLVDINKVFDFILAIEEFTNSFTTINIQISIDGPPGPFSEQGHHGNWSVYRSNFLSLIQLINATKLRKVEVVLYINATVAKDLYLTKFLDYKEMTDYVRYMYNFMKEMDDQCLNRALRVGSLQVFPTYANPSKDTAEDGIKMLAICRLWDQVRRQEFPELSMDCQFYKGTGEVTKNSPLFVNNAECGELNSSYTINYDGSICECSGSFIDYYEPYQQELLDTNEISKYQIAQIHNSLVYNPGKASKEEKEKYKWVIYNGYRNNQSTYLHLMMAQAIELAKSGQIDPIYLQDKDLLLKHLIAMSNVNACSRENVSNTKIPYLISIGTLRRYLNGFMNYIYNDQKQYNKFQAHFCKGE